jgi:Protein of unknown function (DUF2934)
MVKKASSNAVKTPSGKAKSSNKKAPAASAARSPAIELASRPPEEHRIRERAYGIWIEEGRPHGRDVAHWQRAHQELQQEA